MSRPSPSPTRGRPSSGPPGTRKSLTSLSWSLFLPKICSARASRRRRYDEEEHGVCHGQVRAISPSRRHHEPSTLDGTDVGGKTTREAVGLTHVRGPS